MISEQYSYSCNWSSPRWFVQDILCSQRVPLDDFREIVGRSWLDFQAWWCNLGHLLDRGDVRVCGWRLQALNPSLHYKRGSERLSCSVFQREPRRGSGWWLFTSNALLVLWTAENRPDSVRPEAHHDQELEPSHSTPSAQAFTGQQTLHARLCPQKKPVIWPWPPLTHSTHLPQLPDTQAARSPGWSFPGPSHQPGCRSASCDKWSQASPAQYAGTHAAGP